MEQLHTLTAIVEAAAKREKAFKRCKGRIVLDLAALCAGARVVVMLDYVLGLQVKGLMQLVEALSASGLISHCCALTLDGCHYIASHPSLLQYCTHLICSTDHTSVTSHTKQQGLRPVMIRFSHSGAISGAVPAVMLPEEAHAVLGQLHGLVTALAGSTTPGQLIDMGRIKGLPLMPTLNGLLLCYPVVYVVTGGMEGAQQAAKSLSSQALTLVTAHGELPQSILQALQEEASQVHAGAVGSAADVLSAFSVPSHLWQAAGPEATTTGGASSAVAENAVDRGSSALDIQAAVASWGSWLEQQLQGSGVGWRGWRAQDVGIRSINL